MDRVVFHVDMDAFYAAVETRDDPCLRQVPVVIGADPQGGRGRGVVSTANYLARRFGIHSAMPISKAYEACPHATYLRPDFHKYKAASHEVMAVLQEYADVLEVVGMDEAYLDMTDGCSGDFLRARDLARSLQAAVKRRTGLSCSIGIATTKAVAKIASDRRKPHGITVVAPDDVARFLDPLPVILVNGCGPKTAHALREWGYETIGDLARAPRTFLVERFGKHGAWLWRIANGDDPRPVVADRGPAKSSGNERTFLEDVQDPERVRRTAVKLLNRLLDEQGHAFSTITVKLRYSDFQTLTRSHTVQVPFEPDNADTWQHVQGYVVRLLQPLLDGRAVRLVGVRLSGFSEPRGQRALTQFGMEVPTAA